MSLILKNLPQLLNHQNFEDGATPLHWAAQDNREKNVSLLLSKGALMHTDHMGEMPLHLAAMNGFLGCAQLLCTPETVNVVSSEGNTPLHLATMNANKRLVAYLLSQGADADLANKNKETPRGIAASKKDKQLLDYFDPEKLSLLEEIAKVRDREEELIGKTVDLTNARDAEIRKRETAYTVIKLREDRIEELEAEVRGNKQSLEQAQQKQDEQAKLIAELQAKLNDAESKASSLQGSIDAAASQPPPSPTVKDFPSELIYARVLKAQTELQKLHGILEQSEQAILSTKMTINQLEETLGR